jgi:tRNA nucleotidyltransferase (CCA-adding enzyme)
LNTDTLKLIGKIVERFGIYIAVGLFVFFAFNGWKSMSKQAELWQQRNVMLEKQYEAWNQYIGELVKQQKEVVKKVEEKKVEQKLIKLDVGKEIKSFNKTVKEIKKIEDPQESIDALMRAWNND